MNRTVTRDQLEKLIQNLRASIDGTRLGADDEGIFYDYSDGAGRDTDEMVTWDKVETIEQRDTTVAVICKPDFGLYDISFDVCRGATVDDLNNIINRHHGKAH